MIKSIYEIGEISMKIEENKNLTQRVISEVSQIIDMLPERSINQIPADIRNFFKN